MYRKWSVLLLAGAVIFIAVGPALGGGKNPDPGIVPPGSHPYGKTYGEWSGAWWRWALSIPASVNPLLDTTGEFAAEDQSGPVWFLAGVWGGGTAERTVTVPVGKALFFPIYNYVWVNAPQYGDPEWTPEWEATVRQMIADIVESAGPLACEIDGVQVADITAYRCQTPAGGEYMVTLPDDNLFGIAGGTYGPSVDDGYYLMLAPLTAGLHTIHFSVAGFLDVTYHLTVGAAPPPGPLPPKAKLFGYSLAEWLKFYWTWYFTGVPESGELAGALFLPLPAGTPDGGAGTYDDPVTYTGHLDIEIKAGEPFVLPLIAWLGEIYEDGSIDPPYPNEWFGTYVSGPVTLDGQPIIQDFQAYYVPPTNFDEIIYYPEPSSYGSIGLAYFQGVGFVCAPLSAGVHELTNNAGFMIPPDTQPYENFGLIYKNSWTITVVP